MVNLSRLCGDEKGTTAVEYGLIIAFVVLAMIAGLGRFSAATIGMWDNVATTVTTSS